MTKHRGEQSDGSQDLRLGLCPATLIPNLMEPTQEDYSAALDAAMELGCTELSVWASHLAFMGDLRSRGLHVHVLEGATAWANGSSAEAAAEANEFASLAAELDSPLVMAFVVDPSLNQLEVAQENLRGLVAAAEGVGARVCLEFLPFGGIPDLATAWKMVEPLGSGALLTIDTWHWTKQPEGPAPEILTAIPGDRIAYIQVSDVSPTAQEYMFIEAGFGRLLPGEGIADYETFFGALGKTDAHPFIAPEVFSQDLVNGRGPLEAARAARDATLAVLR